MKKIIIAKDIQLILEKVHSFLNRMNIQIYTSQTNDQVLSLHRAEKADLIITHLDTPDMSAETLSSRIRNDRELRTVSLIIVCSGTEAELKRCLECSANAFITLPIDTATLLQEIHHLLQIAHRKSCRVPVSIKVRGTIKEIPFTGYGENISASGMLFHSDTFLFEGDTLTCNFYLPDSTHITTEAEVVRIIEKKTEHDANGYGIKFINLSPQFAAALEAFAEKESKNK